MYRSEARGLVKGTDFLSDSTLMPSPRRPGASPLAPLEDCSFLSGRTRSSAQTKALPCTVHALQNGMHLLQIQAHQDLPPGFKFSHRQGVSTEECLIPQLLLTALLNVVEEFSGLRTPASAFLM